MGNIKGDTRLPKTGSVYLWNRTQANTGLGWIPDEDTSQQENYNKIMEQSRTTCKGTMGAVK